MPPKKGSRRKYGKAASKSVESAMRREKRGTLRSGKGGKGGKVTSRKQAIASAFPRRARGVQKSHPKNPVKKSLNSQRGQALLQEAVIGCRDQPAERTKREGRLPASRGSSV